MSTISFSYSGSNGNVAFNFTMNTLDGDWIISGCSLHDSVSVKYCEDNCKMKEHCKVWLEYKAKKDAAREKVQFT